MAIRHVDLESPLHMAEPTPGRASIGAPGCGADVIRWLKTGE